MKKLFLLILLFILFSIPIHADYINGPANMREKPSGRLLLSLDDKTRVIWDTYYNNWYFVTLHIAIEDNSLTDNKIIKKGSTLYDDINFSKIGATL